MPFPVDLPAIFFRPSIFPGRLNVFQTPKRLRAIPPLIRQAVIPSEEAAAFAASQRGTPARPQVRAKTMGPKRHPAFHLLRSPSQILRILRALGIKKAPQSP